MRRRERRQGGGKHYEYAKLRRRQEERRLTRQCFVGETIKEATDMKEREGSVEKECPSKQNIAWMERNRKKNDWNIQQKSS